jgi:hypothetical protein
MKDFIFDINDYLSIPGLQRPWDGERPFLVPVFFKKQVLTKYFFDPAYKIQFHSETYGTIFPEDDFYISFGINPNGLVIMWLGDIDKLSEKERLYLLSYNVPSDHNIASEFYDAQINVEWTDPIKEVEIFIQKSKLNLIFKNKFGFFLFSNNQSDINEELDNLYGLCSKYKKLLIAGEDEFKKIIEEWNENLIEDLNLKELKKFLNNEEKDVGSIKLLEKFIKEKLNEKENLIMPYFVLYDLRIWATHKDCQYKFNSSLTRLKISEQYKDNYQIIYKKLIEEIIKFHNILLKRIEKYEKFN